MRVKINRMNTQNLINKIINEILRSTQFWKIFRETLRIRIEKKPRPLLISADTRCVSPRF